MPLVQAKCTNCGANLEVDNTKDAAICPSCGTPFIVEKAINNYNTTNNIRADVVNVYGGNGADYVIRAGTLLKYNGAATDVVIPNSVVKIASKAFEGCTELTSVIIPTSVISIGDHTFWDCSSLTSVSIPPSVTSIGNSAFWGCKSLTSIIIPPSVTSIGNSAFEGCKSLTNIIIPPSVTSIGNSAFWGCKSLTSIIIPPSVTSIGNRAFWGCESLTSIIIPPSVTRIGDGAFEKWTKIIVAAGNPAYSSQDGGLFNEDKTTLIRYCSEENEEYVIPSSVLNVGDDAFSGCSNLKSVSIPSSVTSIGDRAFSGCVGLENVEIPNSVTSIGVAAFIDCSNLTSITIPDSVMTIGFRAFKNCSSLTSVTIQSGKTICLSDSDGDRATFEGCTSLTDVTLPRNYILGSSYRDIFARTPYAENRDSENKNGCYIATAVYGSYDCPQVWTLRRYRDNQLAKSLLGRAFIRCYYAISPYMVKWFGKTDWFRSFWKRHLDKLIHRLKDEGVADTPYCDRKW